MSHLKDIQAFGDWIEENIEDPFDLDEAIKTINMSKFHFYRLFKAVIGLSILEYVKRRKMAHAARKLRTSPDSILNIAIQFGFASQEVFIRNFKKYYGDTPAKWRKRASLAEKSILPVSAFDLEALILDIKSYNGKADVSERIVHFEKRCFIGIIHPSDDSRVESIGPKIEHFLSRIDEIEGVQGDALYRICYEPDFSGETATFMEFIGVPVDGSSPVPEGMSAYSMDASTFVEYTHKGLLFNNDKDLILHTYDFIYKYRLAASRYRLKNDYFVERYGDRFYGPFHADSEVDILLSIESPQVT